jgi:hypothetical protein
MGLGRTAIVAPPAKGIAAPPTGKPFAWSYAPAAIETLAAIMRDSNQPPRARANADSIVLDRQARANVPQHRVDFLVLWLVGSWQV